MSARFSSLAFAGAALVGIAAIGVGASATFTDSASSTHTITAGTLDVKLYSPTAPGCYNAGHSCDAITLPAVSPVGSAFETTPVVITPNNMSNIPATYNTVRISAAPAADNASWYLGQQINVCIVGTNPSGNSWVEGNGPLTTGTGLDPSVVSPYPFTLAAGHHDASFSVSFYAGLVSANCGAQVPAGWSTPLEPSLTNNAMGGSITPTVTFSFTG